MRVAKEFWVPLRLQNDEEPLPEKHPLRAVYDFASTIALAALLLVGIITFAGKPVRVFGESMLPTLKPRQRVVITAALFRPRYGDIVVISDAGTRLTPPEAIIKRVIGLPGDVIDIDFDAHIVYRNGKALDEPYTHEPTSRRDSFEGPLTVKEGAVFVMGDNRNPSSDSRDSRVGLVDQRFIMGRVLFK